MTRRYVIMGVSGCGKSVIGTGLAAAIGARFVDGDDLHPPSNVAKMASGQPLTDGDRAGWLDRVAETLRDAEATTVIACSALRRAYRDKIRAGAGGPVTFLHLAGSRAVIGARMAARKDHFMPAALLESQFAALEPPGEDEAAVTVDIDRPAAAIISDLASRFDPDAD